jgi:hypothetical protein
MLMPAKHIKLSESLLGLSSFVLSRLNKPKTIDLLWREFRVASESNEYPAYHSFENLILAIDFLYLLGTINVNDVGEIYR